jgi:hypothetical protein
MAPVKYQVWWIPQVPMKSFNVDVETPEAGSALCDILGKYDAFQFENNIKPDYCNAGGVCFSHPTLTDGEWWDWPDDEDEREELLREIAMLNPEQVQA